MALTTVLRTNVLHCDGLSPRTTNNDVIPSIETAHYVIFLFADWSQLHRLNLVAM